MLSEIDQFCHVVNQCVADPKWLAFGYVGAMDDRFDSYYSAGCTALWYGIESGNEEVRKSLAKKFTNEKIREDIAKTVSAGI
ncbi:hypothetical protein YTPLAS18_03500 [Nitrospira sp.]|nr:hypothetical protein YTPLAS18_03500 [Nitrospira sp.]